MKRLDKTDTDLTKDLKGPSWKVEIAKVLRNQTSAWVGSLKRAISVGILKVERIGFDGTALKHVRWIMLVKRSKILSSLYHSKEVLIITLA